MITKHIVASFLPLSARDILIKVKLFDYNVYNEVVNEHLVELLANLCRQFCKIFVKISNKSFLFILLLVYTFTNQRPSYL